MDKPLRIITADERFAEKSGAKLTLLGKSGIGKTSQLRTLPEASTLFVDLEAGDLAVKAWRGDCVRPVTWPEFRDLVVFLSGPNPALPPDAPFSDAHYRHVCEGYGDPARLAKYDTYFVDSITVLSRLCLTWAKAQPQAFSDRTGKPDTRGAYGLLGTEMIAALTHLQHARDKNVIFVAILDERLDDFNRRVFVPQIEGSKTALELPGIVDEVVTLAELKTDEGELYRAFVCQTLNPWGYPAKDRFFASLNSGFLPAIPRFAAGGAVGNAVSQMAMMAGDNGATARDVVDLRFHVGGKPHTVQSSRETAMQLAQALRELSRGA